MKNAIPANCWITLLPTTNHLEKDNTISYNVTIDTKTNPKKELTLCWDDEVKWEQNQFLDDYRHIINGLILNNKWEAGERVTITEEVLEKLRIDKNYPRTQSEKYDYFFSALIDRQQFAGQEQGAPPYPEEFYFFNPKEMMFFLHSYEEEGLISFDPYNKYKFHITYKGLLKGIQLQESGGQSNRCFIAMSFSENELIDGIRKTILKSCELTGHTGIIMDQVNLPSDQTINDGIVAEIKKAKFAIADFTEQKDGVYFEAGYAAGKGLNVIYSCHDDWFGKSHFDTRHFPHVTYSSNEELLREMVNKINAWID